MMREDKFVQVYVNKVKEDTKTQYLFTVHPSPNRPKGCFRPVHIGTITLDSSNHLTLQTLTEWAKEGKQSKKTELNMKIVYLFTGSINKCLTELLTYDLPELSFLAGKLQYRKTENVMVDWSTAQVIIKITNLLLDNFDRTGIPGIPQAQYLLQVIDNPIHITSEVYLKSNMPINANYEFTMSDRSLRKHLWWEFSLPITEEVWEEKFEYLKGFTFRDGSRLIYTLPLNSLADLPIQVWMYTKEAYSILPDFYDEKSFAVAKTLTSFQKRGEL